MEGHKTVTTPLCSQIHSSFHLCPLFFPEALSSFQADSLCHLGNKSLVGLSSKIRHKHILVFLHAKYLLSVKALFFQKEELTVLRAGSLALRD